MNKWTLLSLLFVLVLSVMLYIREKESKPMTDSRQQFVKLTAYQSPLRKGRRYEGQIQGVLQSSSGFTTPVSGTLGWGYDDSQMLLHWRGSIADQEQNIDLVVESGVYYVRSHEWGRTGSIKDPSRKFALGLLSNTHGHFIRLTDFGPAQRFSYLITPSVLLGELSGALLGSHQVCRDLCLLQFDADLIPQGRKDIFGLSTIGIEDQKLYYEPIKERLRLDVLRMHNVGLYGYLSKQDLKLFRNKRGLSNRTYSLYRSAQDHHHAMSMEVHRNEQRLRSGSLEYDAYPDGRNAQLSLDEESGMSLRLYGTRFDQGLFRPVIKGQIMDIYGILSSKS